jgi:hypothetical protein
MACCFVKSIPPIAPCDSSSITSPRELLNQPRILSLLDPFRSLRNLLIIIMRFDSIVHKSSHRFGLQEAHIDLLRHVEVFIQTAARVFEK